MLCQKFGSKLTLLQSPGFTNVSVNEQNDNEMTDNEGLFGDRNDTAMLIITVSPHIVRKLPRNNTMALISVRNAFVNFCFKIHLVHHGALFGVLR